MKMQAKTPSKGQITVPVKVRRALGVRAGDKLLFEKDGANFRMRPVKTRSPLAKYRGIGIPGSKSGGRKTIIRRIREMRGR
jgi:AbrB family looped-hinge helix DNA binding protein